MLHQELLLQESTYQRKEIKSIIQRVSEEIPGLYNCYELQQNERQEQQQHERRFLANGISQLSKIESMVKDF
jgi:hypothetical protein